jgi:hypothetical protein
MRPRISKLQFFIKKKNVQLHFFLQFLVIKTPHPEPDRDFLEMLDPDP